LIIRSAEKPKWTWYAKRAGFSMHRDFHGFVVREIPFSVQVFYLCFAGRRKQRSSEPVLICPAPVATAKSAMVVSSVSPERWLITVV
jgi:hypothetical protein